MMEFVTSVKQSYFTISGADTFQPFFFFFFFFFIICFLSLFLIQSAKTSTD